MRRESNPIMMIISRGKICPTYFLTPWSRWDWGRGKAWWIQRAFACPDRKPAAGRSAWPGYRLRSPSSVDPTRPETQKGQYRLRGKRKYQYHRLGRLFLQTDDNPSNLKVTISENDFARVICHGVTLQKILFPPLMSLPSNVYVISVCK